MENLINHKIAERLIKLRKQNGLSQAQLANELGLTRQAISKWERGAASPDADNLICLANIFGVKIDYLLSGSENIIENKDDDLKDTSNQDKANTDRANIKPHIEKNQLFNIISIIVTSFYAVASIIGYILLGFYVNNGWLIGWLLLLLIPVIGSVFVCIAHKRISEFCFPVLSLAVFLFVGFYTLIWHPTWVILISIPIFYLISLPIDKFIKNKTQKNPSTSENTTNEKDKK